MNKAIAIVVILCASVGLPASSQEAKDSAQSDRAAKLEAKLAEALRRVEELEKEVATLKAQRDAKGTGGKDPAAKQEIDQVPLASKWRGRLTGRNGLGQPIDEIANAEITARTADGFQIRMTLPNNLVWSYDCRKDGAIYRIVQAELKSVPPGFDRGVGEIAISDSRVVIGPKSLDIALSRKQNINVLTAAYKLQRQSD